MPGGGRRTHDFPHGKPVPLILVEIAFAISFIASASTFGFRDWRGAAPTLAIVVAYLVAYSVLIRRYERLGRAVRRNNLNVVVRFPEGFPKPLLGTRIAFFVVVGVMLVFGIVPFPFEVVKKGIISCVFALIGVAVANVLLEWHYVKAGRAVNIEFIRKPKENPRS